MAKPPADPYSSAGMADHTGGAPRWVKVFGIIAFVVLLLFVILMFTRGPGGRGPVHRTSEGIRL
jgi:hypothetical protein